MQTSVNAVYENGALRPLEKLDLDENEEVRITIQRQRRLPPELQVIEDMIDWECMENCEKELREGPVPTLDEVRQALSKIPGSLVDDIRAERDMR